ncbi:FMR1-interacting protein NUFIP2 [Lissotriton helveticus]
MAVSNLDSRYNIKQIVQAGGSFLGRGPIKTKNVIQKSIADKKNVKVYENKQKDILPVGKTDVLPLTNGIEKNDSGCVANGCGGQTADNDGSGSESGYNTPKKRKAQRTEDLGLLQDRVMQLEAASLALTQDLENFNSDHVLEREGSQLGYTKASWRYEAGDSVCGKPGAAEVQRKNSDGKPNLGKKLDERLKCKQPVTGTSGGSSKDDSWTLFKPPPVFPVDNSSAKIVPKISYASKVKENLNKAAQTQSLLLCSSSSLSSSSSGEAQLQTSSRLMHVPMSAMKSVTSASFSNGPVLAGTDGASYSPGSQAMLTSAASTLVSPSASAASRDINTAAVAVEQKTSLFIYPSNMQSLLVGMTPTDISGQTNQQSLGEIFQNKWGLSFINEPSAGPESMGAQPVNELNLTFQENYTEGILSHSDENASSGRRRVVFPKAYELDKRTSPPVLSSLLKSGVPNLETVLASEPHHIGELQKTDPGIPDALLFLSKDYEIDSLRASPTNALLASAKEQRCPGSIEKNHSWGTFDTKAAIIYHTREMEYIWHLQKQDPKRIITYDEAMDHAAH